MPELEWSQPARADLLAIVDYISDDNPDAAQWLKDDIETKATRLSEHPRLYRVGRVEGTSWVHVVNDFARLTACPLFVGRITDYLRKGRPSHHYSLPSQW